MSHLQRLLGLLLIFSLLGGCGAKVPHQIVSEYAKRGLRVVAVLPAEIESGDPAAARMLREKLVDELHFKGYPRVPFNLIDAALAGAAAVPGGRITPQEFGRFLKVDALLYATLKEGRMGSGILFGRTLVDAEFELRSVRTGESLWRVRYASSHRHFGISRKSIELKASQVYEEAVQEVVGKALSTLPDADAVTDGLSEGGR